MNEPKHTPGPWYKDICGKIWRRDPSDLWEYGGGVFGDEPIATVWVGWYGEDEVPYPVDANARLMASAPDLLEALYIVDACGEPNPVELYDGEAEGWEWAHPDGRKWYEVGCWEDPPPMHPVAKAAIAKAEGTAE